MYVITKTLESDQSTAEEEVDEGAQPWRMCKTYHLHPEGSLENNDNVLSWDANQNDCRDNLNVICKHNMKYKQNDYDRLNENDITVKISDAFKNISTKINVKCKKKINVL